MDEHKTPREENQPREGYLRVDVSGEDKKLWIRLQEKLVSNLESVLDSITDGKRGEWLREESKKITAGMLDYVNSKLQRPGLENDKIEAEVHKLFAEREKNLAEARKINAEAEAIEFDTAMKKLRLMLLATRAVLIKEEGQEALLLGQKIDAFLEAIKAIAE